MNANFERFKKDFKRDLLVRVVVQMKHSRIRRKTASSLAREILEIFKEERARETFVKLNKLSESYPEVLDIFIKRGYEYDEREKEEQVNQIIVYLTNSKGGLPPEALAKGGEIN